MSKNRAEQGEIRPYTVQKKEFTTEARRYRDSEDAPNAGAHPIKALSRAARARELSGVTRASSHLRRSLGVSVPSAYAKAPADQEFHDTRRSLAKRGLW